MIKIIESINVQPLLQAYVELEEQIQWTDYGHKGKQAGLQYRVGEDPWTSAVGKCVSPEHTYTEINPFFKDTVFETIIIKYNLLRTRLMVVGPYACYSMHRDTTPRIHIPLITTSDCYFVFKDNPPIHMPIRKVFWADTTKFHTFINCSDKPRLHLIGVVIANY